MNECPVCPIDYGVIWWTVFTAALSGVIIAMLLVAALFRWWMGD